ncbi:TomO hydrophobic C-terminal domain-containing protein [Wolbachia endosymbiont of Dirofilaria (Dirofilaria) immitis]|uniref:TomO hydrophobic C-terminal domain-containing protein n=1 Tax=Wolbachia endosymbiont of Dirofilaria (Dirofilaria) immitis TaxID=1812115 RepID=UPI00158DEF51|nr:hypothetical protein [Wolbachia endosymbiont of Dirofilaria (Dirofilaria) immitis]QKX02053.1 hypothetical protein GOY12_00380 [Wolbachia endosymbiont of Dirofilaria (Dirofilaria) immitis]
MCKSKKKKNHNSKPPNAQEQQEVLETQVPEQIAIAQSEGVSSSTQKSQSECINISPVVNDTKKKQVPNQLTEQTTSQIKGELELESKDSQADSSLHLLESSTNSDRSHSSSSFSAVDVSSDNGGSPFESIDKGENVSIPERSSSKGPQTKKQSQDQYRLYQSQHRHPLVTNKKSKQTNNTILQDTKNNNLHFIAASVLTTAVVALGVATAVHLEISVVGIVVGACCLAAAAIIYYYMPKSLIENSKVEGVDIKKKPTVAL